MYRKMESDFDRSFRRTGYFIKAVFVVIFLMIIGFFSVYGYVGYKLYNAGAAGAGHAVGEFLNGVKQGSAGN